MSAYLTLKSLMPSDVADGADKAEAGDTVELE